MSLLNKLFGSPKPGDEKSDTPAGSAANQGSPPAPAAPANVDKTQVLTREQLFGKPAASESKKDSEAPPAAVPAEAEKPAPPPDEIEHTQFLTKAQTRELMEKDKQKSAQVQPAEPGAAEKKKPEPKPVAFTGPTIAVAVTPEKPSEELPEKSAPPAPKADAPPLKPATWKTDPVREPWCPVEIAKEFPELARVENLDHVACERIVSADWRLVGASRRGRKQAFDSRFREDAFAFAALPTATILCVSDGAGSSKYARIGSHVAVTETTRQLREGIAGMATAATESAEALEKFLKEQTAKALHAARDRVLAIAEKAKLSHKDLRGTMLTVVHFKSGTHELLLANQVGDGAICFLLKDLTVKRIASGDSGKFSGEVACFFPDEEAKTRIDKVEVIPNVADIEAFFLCSDGIEDPFYPIDKKAGDIFRQWYAGVAEPLKDFKTQPPQPALVAQEAASWALAQWLEFEKRGENDDRTVLLLHRRASRVAY